jgi:hypothetical protein
VISSPIGHKSSFGKNLKEFFQRKRDEVNEERVKKALVIQLIAGQQTTFFCRRFSLSAADT